MKSVLRRAPLLALSLLAIVGTIAGGCSKKDKLNPLAIENHAPVVRITAAPIDTNATCTPDPARSCYSLTLNWVGYDADGRVDHYVYAVDPQDDQDTTWIITTDNEKRLVFDAPSTSPYSDSLSILRGYHVFVIAAVDNKGAIGPRVNRAFFSFTQAPRVTITNPRPVRSAVRTLPPSIRITWSGVDDDGVFTTKPVYYKYLLLGPGNESSVIPGGINAIFASGGSAIRRYYAPLFADSLGWKRIGGDTTTVQFTDLVPGATYLFTVVGFDEAGAFSPVFLFDTNVIRFTIGFAAAFGPKITVFNESFFKVFSAAFNPNNTVDIEVPAGQKVNFFWIATAPEGADITSYRWMLDGPDVFDDTPRTDELHDLKHWSAPASTVTSASIGPFNEAGSHFFYISAEDNTGLRSLATIHLTVVVPTFDRRLLVVDDTRYEPDGFFASGAKRTYAYAWPAAAELDTFLYALGGVEWENYGVNSTPGLLAAYGRPGDPDHPHPNEYDTLGTRKGVPNLSVSLATLGAYRHVIWMTDYLSATYGKAGNEPDRPSTALRYMSAPGRLNSLGAYVRMGGEGWLVGGGGTYATLIGFNSSTNDVGSGTTVWNYDILNHQELGPGRFMYDVPKWQSIITSRGSLSRSDSSVVRRLGRFRSNPGIYADVPYKFGRRTASTDPLPPKRVASQFHDQPYAAEYITGDNAVFETVIGEPLDFRIDQFEDANAAAIGQRWVSSDGLNTVVGQGTVTGATGTRASGKSMLVTTQGGGASTGDRITFDFGATHTRDFSGLTALRVALKQDQPVSAVLWRVRVYDSRGSSSSALLPSNGTSWQDVSITTFAPDPGSPFMTDYLHIRRLEFELVRGDAAATTEFDNIDVQTAPESYAVVDTLMSIRVPPNEWPIMTVYHGHDFAKPFVFTGFAPWDFQRSQCQALFDFVLQKLWGITPGGSGFATARAIPAFLPAHSIASPPPRTLPGLRDGLTQRGSGAGLRQTNPIGARPRRNGTP